MTDAWDFGTSSNFSADTLLGAIYNKGGNLCVLYTDPDIAYTMNTLWANKWRLAFDKWLEAINTSYSPLENYRMIEETEYSKEMENLNVNQLSASILSANDVSRRLTGSETTSDDVSTDDDTTVTTTVSGTNGNTNTVSKNSFDSANLKVDTQTVDSGTNSSSTSQVTDGTVSSERDISTTTSNTEVTDNDTTTTSNQNGRTTDSGSENFEQTLTRSGNIGVTTSQQMLESEMELRGKYNVYNMMADVFIREMAIGLYY